MYFIVISLFFSKIISKQIGSFCYFILLNKSTQENQFKIYSCFERRNSKGFNYSYENTCNQQINETLRAISFIRVKHFQKLTKSLQIRSFLKQLLYLGAVYDLNNLTRWTVLEGEKLIKQTKSMEKWGKIWLICWFARIDTTRRVSQKKLMFGEICVEIPRQCVTF